MWDPFYTHPEISPWRGERDEGLIDLTSAPFFAIALNLGALRTPVSGHEKHPEAAAVLGGQGIIVIQLCIKVSHPFSWAWKFQQEPA